MNNKIPPNWRTLWDSVPAGEAEKTKSLLEQYANFWESNAIYWSSLINLPKEYARTREVFMALKDMKSHHIWFTYKSYIGDTNPQYYSVEMIMAFLKSAISNWLDTDRSDYTLYHWNPGKKICIKCTYTGYYQQSDNEANTIPMRVIITNEDHLLTILQLIHEKTGINYFETHLFEEGENPFHLAAPRALSSNSPWGKQGDFTQKIPQPPMGRYHSLRLTHKQCYVTMDTLAINKIQLSKYDHDGLTLRIMTSNKECYAHLLTEIEQAGLPKPVACRMVQTSSPSEKLLAEIDREKDPKLLADRTAQAHDPVNDVYSFYVEHDDSVRHSVRYTVSAPYYQGQHRLQKDCEFSRDKESFNEEFTPLGPNGVMTHAQITRVIRRLVWMPQAMGTPFHNGNVEEYTLRLKNDKEMDLIKQLLEVVVSIDSNTLEAVDDLLDTLRLGFLRTKKAQETPALQLKQTVCQYQERISQMRDDRERSFIKNKRYALFSQSISMSSNQELKQRAFDFSRLTAEHFL